MIGRSREILERFPAHFEAARPGKVLGEVVDALAQDLDMLAARLAAVRRAHRLGEADEISDLLLIGAMHGISEGELELLFMRFARAGALAAKLHDAADPARDAAAEALLALWSLSASPPRLPSYAPAVSGGGAPDLNAARKRLLDSVSVATRYRELTGALRKRIAGICRVHAGGNGTVQAVMEGAANALDLDMDAVISSVDRFWHAALVHDRLRLTHPVPKLDKAGNPTSGEVPARFDVEDEIVALEENPIQRITTDSIGRSHTDRWSITRRGFDRALTQIRITGIGDRTIGPMVVDCDEGRGFGYAGSVPHGKTLIFTEEGRAQLDGADVTASAYAWEGGCFADTDRISKNDFTFDGVGRDPKKRPATFVTTTPADALDREAVYPHGDVTLPVPGMPVGVTRFAFFIQEGHFNDTEVRLAVPRSSAAFFDASVFAPPPPPTRQPSAEVAFSWLENRPFSARLLIPARFRNLTDDVEGTEVRRRVSIAVERFRPLGIELTVDFIDHRWVLGQGQMQDGQGADVIEKLRAAMVLWEAPA